MRTVFPASLFAGQPGAHGMVQAALSGMGRVWTDSPENPRCAVAAAGDFLYCGGEAEDCAVQLLRQALTSASREWLIYAPGAWREALERIGPAEEITRWAFDPRVQPEDAHLRALLEKLPAGARLQPIEGPWIPWCRQFRWSEDFVSLYTDEAYARKGLGVLLMVDGEVAAGASSYVSYPGGIEIQLQTRDDRQGRGYATLAAAKLILMAHERGLSAGWDAANEASAHIAQKLGYRSAGSYRVCVLESAKMY